MDGSDPQTVASATNTASAMALSRSSELLVGRLAASGSGLGFDPIGLEPDTWYNPEVRTAVYVVPGLVGVILTMTMVMLTAMAIARERERGTLEQLIVSPVKKLELVVGKIVPYIAIGYIQMTLILGAGSVVFDVPLSGSIALLYALAFVFILTLGNLRGIRESGNIFTPYAMSSSRHSWVHRVCMRQRQQRIRFETRLRILPHLQAALAC